MNNGHRKFQQWANLSPSKDSIMCNKDNESFFGPVFPPRFNPLLEGSLNPYPSNTVSKDSKRKSRVEPHGEISKDNDPLVKFEDGKKAEMDKRGGKG